MWTVVMKRGGESESSEKKAGLGTWKTNSIQGILGIYWVNRCLSTGRQGKCNKKEKGGGWSIPKTNCYLNILSNSVFLSLVAKSCPTLATLWTVAWQAPLSMGFSRQEYWSGLPCSSRGIFPTQAWNPRLLHLPALAGEFFTTSATWEAHLYSNLNII